MKVWMKIGIFEQVLFEVIVSPLPECIIGMDIMSYWGTFPPPSLVKQKACKSIHRPVLIGHAKWEPLELPEPTQVVIAL